MSADTYGILTKPAAVAAATLLAISTLVGVGWKLRDAVSPAQAAQPALEEKVNQMAIDIAVIKTQLQEIAKRVK